MNKNQPPQHLDELVALVQKEFPGMTQQFQVGARYLIDFPAEVPIASMRQIARQSGVQPATLVRLAQYLGFEGWDSLKQVFVQSFRQTPKLYAAQARKVLRAGSPNAMFAKNLASQARNLARLEDLDAERLPAAVELLSAASRVYVAGFRACLGPAFAFQYLYRLFRPTVSILRGDAGTLEMELRALEQGDAVMVMSFAPYSQEALRVVQAAQKARCRVLAVCDSVLAPIAVNADAILLFPTETPSFFPSVAAAQALVEVLVEQLMARSGKRAVNEIEQAEAQLRQTGAYL